MSKIYVKSLRNRISHRYIISDRDLQRSGGQQLGELIRHNEVSEYYITCPPGSADEFINQFIQATILKRALCSFWKEIQTLLIFTILMRYTNNTNSILRGH